MIFLSGLIFLFGLFIEINSAQLLMSNLITMAALEHLFTCLLMTVSAKLFLNGLFTGNNRGFYLLVFLLCYFVPVFGIIISLFIVTALYRLHTKSHKYAEFLDEAINLEEIQPFHAKYGAGGASMRLLKKEETADERSKALFVLSQTQLSNINKLIYQLLPDPSDEMRLLAFNILDEQENRIAKRISESFAMLETAKKNHESCAKFEKNIAMLYWELVYDHLISPELEQSILNRALSYAISASKSLENDATIWILLGKIYKHLKQYANAEKAFNKIELSEVPPATVLPYLAEIKFKMRDYQAVQEYLSQSSTLLDVALIAPVKRFWDK